MEKEVWSISIRSIVFIAVFAISSAFLNGCFTESSDQLPKDDGDAPGGGGGSDAGVGQKQPGVRQGTKTPDSRSGSLSLESSFGVSIDQGSGASDSSKSGDDEEASSSSDSSKSGDDEASSDSSNSVSQTGNKQKDKSEAERIAEEAQRKRLADEAERVRLANAEAERVRLANAEAERVRLANAEAERVRLAEAEAERVRLPNANAEAEAERVRLAEAAAERENSSNSGDDEEASRSDSLNSVDEAERVRLAEAEAERVRLAEAEAERLRLVEAEAEAAERERVLLAEAEALRIRIAEAEAERVRRLAEAEAERVRLAEAEAERVRLAEAEAERVRLAEIARQAEVARQRAIEEEARRARDAELAEQARLQAIRDQQQRDAEAARIAEEQEQARVDALTAAEKDRLEQERVEAERLEARQARERERERQRLEREAERRAARAEKKEEREEQDAERQRKRQQDDLEYERQKARRQRIDDRDARQHDRRYHIESARRYDELLARSDVVVTHPSNRFVGRRARVVRVDRTDRVYVVDILSEIDGTLQATQQIRVQADHIAQYLFDVSPVDRPDQFGVIQNVASDGTASVEFEDLDGNKSTEEISVTDLALTTATLVQFSGVSSELDGVNGIITQVFEGELPYEVTFISKSHQEPEVLRVRRNQVILTTEPMWDLNVRAKPNESFMPGLSPGTKHYETLGVPVGSDHTVCSKAYRKLALKCHPDKNGNKPKAQRDALQKQFVRITEAWEVLQDPEKKAEYDRNGV